MEADCLHIYNQSITKLLPYMRQKRLSWVIPSGLFKSPFLSTITASFLQPQIVTKSYTYEIIRIVLIESYRYADSYYFFPIMKTELAKARVYLNPGGLVLRAGHNRLAFFERPLTTA